MRTLNSQSTCGLLAMSLIVLFSGCGGGDGSLAENSSLAGDTYLALDLDSGAIIPVGNDQGALVADARYHSTHVLFRRIPAGSTELGTDGNLSQGAEAVITSVNYGEFFCAVYELTQDQWYKMAGTTPWTSSLYTAAFNDSKLVIASTMPAWGMSYEQAAEVAAAQSKPGWRVALPTSAQWEIAARAGATRSLFFWGNRSTDVALARTHAVCWAVGDGTPSLSVVKGDRRANAWGLYDFIGNIAEFATPNTGSDAELRGGAYDQPLVVCRVSNVLPVPRDLGLPTTGVRLVLVRE